ncbi:MAG: MBL fold metallo-hydrolase, partial [Proteobacteria bacterium]|nr:MBL fold metallo-hydrolase [Pseudomonadota bacterium]
DAATALGGRDNIENVMLLTIEAGGILSNHGQDMTPESSTLFFAISDYKQVNNLSAKQMRLQLTKTPKFTYFRGPDPITEISGIDGDIAYNLAANGSARQGSASQATDLRNLYYHHPLKLVHAALQPSATLSNGRTVNGGKLVDVTSAEGLMFTLAIDETTKLPSYIMSMENHPNLRDVSMITRFADYQDVDGLTLPTNLSRYIDDVELLTLRVSSQSINGDTVDLSPPSDVASATLPNTTPTEVSAEKIADHIWFLAGGYNSLVVEFSDHLVLFESSSEDRGLAVIAKARELVPGKPLTHLVNTHHHFDHSGGVRAAISEGLTVMTHEANANFYKALATKPSTLIPDSLEQNPKSATIISVQDKMVYEDDTMKFELYHIPGNTHASSLLMAYFPNQKLLYEADVYSSGSSASPFAPNFYETVKALNLDVEYIIPVHGKITPLSEFLEVITAAK